MASETLEPSYLEFLEPDVDKPEPLRIIKRGQRDDFRSFDDASGYDTRQIIGPASKWSHYSRHQGSPPERISIPLKVQKRRKGRGSIIRSSFEDSESSISDQTHADSIIPARLSWAGTFLKSELCRWSSDSIESLDVLPSLDEKACKERKLSRALQSVRSKSMNFLHLNSSEGALSHRDSKFIAQTTVLRQHFEPAISKADSKTLYPELSVIHEYDIIGTDDISLWVAVRVIGAYHGGSKSDAKYPTGTSLYDVNIELAPGIDSVIEELHCHNSSVLRFGEANVVLARIKIRGTDRPRTGHVRQSSEDLMEELETQLGSLAVDYLNIKITYKDSPFPTVRPWIAGVSKYSISSVVKARLTMPRLSGYPLSTALDQIKAMVENSCEPRIARDMINKLHESRVINNSGAERVRLNPVTQLLWNCSSDTITPADARFSPYREKHPPFSSNSASVTLHGQHKLNSDPATPTVAATDPARKIWSDLRRNSRGSKPQQVSSSGVLSQEQNHIRETALRNRRSIGADTLRSMAPPSTQTGLGLGGKGLLAWSWGPPWW